MSETDKHDLDALFAAARDDRPELSDDLTQRILADAAAWQPELSKPASPGLFAQMMDMLGGWPAVGGLATAAAAGLYFGFAQPDLVVPSSLAAISEDAAFELDGMFPDDTLFFEEG